MRYLTDGRYVVTGLLLLLLFFSSLLYLYANAGQKRGNNKIVGELKSKELKILRKLDSEVVWEELDQNDPVRYRDTIRTEEGSQAILLFKDGNNSTEIRMDERSMILIEDVDKISFVAGSLSATNSGGGSNLQISSGDTKISLGNSNVSLSKNEDQALNLEVKNGEAKVVSSNGENILKGNQAAELKGNKVEVRNLTLEQLSPSDGKNLPLKGESLSVLFTWKQEKGVKNYRLELAKDASFRSGLRKYSSNLPEVTASLPAGLYFWRVSGVNPSTEKEESSPVRSVRILPWVSPKLISPSSKEVFSYTSDIPGIRFQWTVSDPTSKFTLEVAEDPRFQQIAFKSESKSGFLKWDPKSDGNYFARLRMFSDKEGFLEESSPIVSFSIRKVTETEPPRLHRPLAGEEIGLRIFKSGNSFFSWSSGREFKSYTLEIASDSQFHKTLFSQSTSTNFLKPNFDWQEGVYYWRVKGNQEGSNARESISQSFLLKQLDSVKLTYPKDGTQSGHPSDGRMTLRWDRPDPSGLYRVEVSRDSSFQSKISESTVRSGSVSVLLPAPGDFYWRVSLVSPNGESLVSSPAASFKTSDSAPFVSPTYPRERDKIDLEEKESLAFYWETQGKTDGYVLELLESKGKNWKSVFKKEIQGETYEFRELYRLKEGKYQWRLSAKYKDESGNVRVTLPVSREFAVVVSASFKAPDILTPKAIYVE
ncbi:transcriptional regulator [Leptospira fletcheri]|uniref:Transcriptional regulator n=1 Tax=Leptospira fletcheri TaxID=2484981 RepID=A0A4R9GJR6_9LEPT|nr:FecR domain-containing protein [Leptospira fletcheri]TGK13972.1 transcriptional regulator [Leptospira fletcheri]